MGWIRKQQTIAEISKLISEKNCDKEYNRSNKFGNKNRREENIRKSKCKDKVDKRNKKNA